MSVGRLVSHWAQLPPHCKNLCLIHCFKRQSIFCRMAVIMMDAFLKWTQLLHGNLLALVLILPARDPWSWSQFWFSWNVSCLVPLFFPSRLLKLFFNMFSRPFHFLTLFLRNLSMLFSNVESTAELNHLDVIRSSSNTNNTQVLDTIILCILLKIASDMLLPY